MPTVLEYDLSEFEKRTRASSDELLARLEYYHCYDVAKPEATLLDAQELSAAEIEIILPAPKPLIVLSSKPVGLSIVNEEIPEPKILDIKRAACRYFELDPIEMVAQRRTHNLTYPRQIAYYISKTLTTRSLPEIGRHFGGRDHTTVLHGVRKITRLMKTDWTVAFDVAGVEACLPQAALGG